MYPEIFSETQNLIKLQTHDKDRKLNESEVLKAKISAGFGVLVDAFLRLGFGFSKDGKYYMYPWLIGAIFDVVTLYYINHSDSNWNKATLGTLDEIKRVLMDVKYYETV